VGPASEEIPYLVRAIPVAAPVEPRRSVLVDPVILRGGGARAVLDLGQPGLKHSRLTLEVEGRDFLRRTRIERSDDARRWDLLAEGAMVFRVSSGVAAPHQSLVVEYPVSDARYLRITVLPGGDGGALRLTGASLVFAPPSSRPQMRTAPLSLESHSSDARARTSTFDFDAGDPGLPYTALQLAVDDAAFERAADLLASDDGKLWVPVSSGYLHRAQVGSLRVESLAFDFAPVRRRHLRVVLHDQDDAPLRVAGAQGSWPAQELVFEARAPGPHSLLVGAPGADPPQYDLAAVLRRRGDVSMHEATLGAFAPNPSFGLRPPLPRPWSERHRPAITAGLLVVLAALALWTLRLLRPKREG
jgi:hypothetical protein